MIEILFGLIAVVYLFTFLYLFFEKRQKPGALAVVIAPVFFFMLFLAEDDMIGVLRLAVILLGIVGAGFAIAAWMNRGVD